MELDLKLVLKCRKRIVKRISILIVEDQATIALDMKALLEDLGYEVVGIVGTEKKAIKMAKKLRPDMALIDIRLKKGDGIDAAVGMQRDLDIAVIFVSAYDDEATLDRAKKCQPLGYLVKPVNRNMLRITLKLAMHNCYRSAANRVRGHDRMKDRTKVFISYSHKDVSYLDDLKAHLRPLGRAGLEIWEDQQMKPGALWQEEIAEALRKARVGVLLVSADFLASDFIAEKELPLLLEAAEKDGVRIFYVVLRPCRVPPALDKFQAVNDPGITMAEMENAEQDRVWMMVADVIQEEFRS